MEFLFTTSVSIRSNSLPIASLQQIPQPSPLYHLSPWIKWKENNRKISTQSLLSMSSCSTINRFETFPYFVNNTLVIWSRSVQIWLPNYKHFNLFLLFYEGSMSSTAVHSSASSALFNSYSHTMAMASVFVLFQKYSHIYSCICQRDATTGCHLLLYLLHSNASIVCQHCIRDAVAI